MHNIYDPALSPVRLDGRAKVTGAAIYTGDYTSRSFQSFLQPGETAGPMLYAAAVQSEHAAGHIEAIDTSEALALPGVRLVLTHENAPRLKKVKTMLQSELTRLLPLQTPRLEYHGQPIALVVAETFEIAEAASRVVKVRYARERGRVDFAGNLKKSQPEKKVGAGEKGHIERGHPRAAFKEAPVKIDQWYSTEPAHHNPIEPAATVAHWHAPSDQPVRLTVVCSTQFVYGDAITLGEAFGLGLKDSMLRFGLQLAFGKELEDSKVRVVAPLIGGGFGSKGGNSHILLAAMAAKVAGQPVKLVLTRQQTFSMMPYRCAARQRMRLGAGSDGKLTALLHESILQSSKTASFVEPAGEITPRLYACENLLVDHRSVPLHLNAPGWMRAPGIAPGQFALESAMDELAVATGVDPLELRLRNDTKVDPESGHPWSSRSLKECLLAGAKAIGWENRSATPGALRVEAAEGRSAERIGYGLATAVYPTNQFPATARITLRADGTAIAQTAAHEIGQGAITVLAQIAAEAMGLPLRSMSIELSDTSLPMAMMAGGSSTTLSVGSALEDAAETLVKRLARLATRDQYSMFYKADPSRLRHRDGLLFDPRTPGSAEAVGPLMTRHGLTEIEAKGIAGRTFGRSPYGRAAFGGQFVRVAVEEATGRIRVTHMVGAFAAGRIMNARTARSQLLGGMVWGLGHALMEQSVVDTRNGAWVNSNLGEAHVPVNADVPQIDVLMIDEDDSLGSRLGVKGIGELGITGVAAAVANAVYNATGRRMRSLPLTLDKLGPA